MSEVAVSGERRLSQQCVLRLPSHPQSCHPPRIINITNLQGRTWPANPHCNYIKYHTHSTNSDQSLEMTWQSSHSRREEKRRGAKERVNSPQWVPGEQVLLTCSPCLSLPFLLVQSCDVWEFSLPYLLCQFDSLSVWNVCPVLLKYISECSAG